MNQKKMEKEFKNIFHTLMFGSPLEFSEAKKRIEKLWHENQKAFEEAAPVVLEYLSKFDQIKYPKNQAAFASGLSLFYLVLGDEYFDELKDFTYRLLQNPHGHVREAIRKSADWLHVSLTAQIDPFVWPEDKPLTVKQLAEQSKSKTEYVLFINEIEDLIDKYDTGENVEYINDMKPSINKSLQLFWAAMTEGPTYRRIQGETHNTSPEILSKRKEIKEEFEELLAEHASPFSFDDILDIIYREDETDDMMKIVRIFDRGNPMELESVLELATDAWNYFPHKLLNGKSPAEMV